MATVLNIVQIIVSVLLVGLIMLQVRGAGLGRTFGSDSGAVKRTRRGLEKTIYQFTIVVAAVFVVVAVASAVLTG